MDVIVVVVVVVVVAVAFEFSGDDIVYVLVCSGGLVQV